MSVKRVILLCIGIVVGAVPGVGALAYGIGRPAIPLLMFGILIGGLVATGDVNVGRTLRLLAVTTAASNKRNPNSIDGFVDWVDGDANEPESGTEPNVDLHEAQLDAEAPLLDNPNTESNPEDDVFWPIAGGLVFGSDCRRYFGFFRFSQNQQ